MREPANYRDRGQTPKPRPTAKATVKRAAYAVGTLSVLVLTMGAKYPKRW